MLGKVIALLVIPMMLLVFILQRLGALTGTCTQGGVGPFMTGVVLSSPMLAAASAYLVLLWRRPSFPSHQEGLAGLAVLSLVVVVSNFEVWKRTLLLAGSACGPDYDYTVEGWDWDQVAIGFVYGVWPFALAIASIILLSRGNAH